MGSREWGVGKDTNYHSHSPLPIPHSLLPNMRSITLATYEEFLAMAGRGTVVPLVKTVMADLLTPVSAYLRIERQSPHAFLLESIEGGEKIARYSFLGCAPHTIVRARSVAGDFCDQAEITIERAGGASEKDGERLREKYIAACGEIARLEASLAAPIEPPPPARRAEPLQISSNMGKEYYLNSVERIKEYIRAGDAFQVVFAQRFETEITSNPFQIYRALRVVNPSPYMFFLKLGDDETLLGASPEMLVRCAGRRLEYRPIAGTYRRGVDEAEDEALARELLQDEKERAEHVMLVDLGRNDLGRVAEYGSVEVADLMFVERFSHVMHLTSSLKATLREGLDCFDALAATFPAGTLSGAPKVRAMEIIDELEPTRRGAYAGSVMYFDYSGNLDSCIVLRTMYSRGRKAYVQAGGGIVADSAPEAEFMETVNKSRALIRAIEIAEKEL